MFLMVASVLSTLCFVIIMFFSAMDLCLSLGVFCFLTKLLAVNSVWNTWFRVWLFRAPDRYKSKYAERSNSNEIDARLLNESTLAVVALESLPNFAL